MKKMLLIISTIIAGAFIMTAWLYCGYYRVDAIEGESHNVYFIKKIPTFRIAFKNTAKMEVWQRKTYSNDGADELLEYCKYRYGLVGDKSKVWQQCNAIEDITLRDD
jgi:hypothetical protein